MMEMQARPPYVVFEMRAIEDRGASQAAGHYVAKDVPFAIVTPAGSKDRYENLADNWFKMLRTEVRAKRFPQQWLDHFQAQYDAWKRGEEGSLNGTPLKTWPVLSPAQYKACRQAHLLTVEDLAAANEETIMRLGMGARALKQKAVDWLASAASTGRVTEEIVALRAAKETLETQNEQLRSDLAVLKAQVEGLLAGKSVPVATPDPVDDEFQAELGVKL